MKEKTKDRLQNILIVILIIASVIFGRGAYLRVQDGRVAFADIFKFKSNEDILEEVNDRYSIMEDTTVAIEEIKEEKTVVLPKMNLKSEIDFDAEVDKIMNPPEVITPKDDMTLEIKPDPKEELTEEQKIEKAEVAVKKTDNTNVVPPKDKKEKLPTVPEKPKDDGIVYINENTRDNNGTIEIFVPGFNVWAPEGGEGSHIQIEDQGGSWDKQVGTMN